MEKIQSKHLLLILLIILASVVCFMQNGYKLDLPKDTLGARQTLRLKEESSPFPAFFSTLPFDCYRNPQNYRTLRNIQSRKVIFGRNIIFLNTVCPQNNEIYLSPIQACAIESAALKNPYFDIHLIITGTIPTEENIHVNETEMDLRSILRDYKNIIMSRIDMETYFTGTPVEKLYKDGLLEASKYPQNELYEVLKYLTTWKYSSIHLDLDMITLKTLENLPNNFAGFANESFGLRIFNFKGHKGQKLINMILKNISENFGVDGWSTNDFVARFLVSKREGFKLYDPEVFYPLTPLEVQNAKTFYVRKVFGFGNTTRFFEKGSNSMIELIFMHTCPQVYKQLPDEIEL